MLLPSPSVSAFDLFISVFAFALSHLSFVELLLAFSFTVFPCVSAHSCKLHLFVSCLHQSPILSINHDVLIAYLEILLLEIVIDLFLIHL